MVVFKSLQKTSSEELNDVPNFTYVIISNTIIMNQVFTMPWYCFLLCEEILLISFQGKSTDNYNSELQGTDPFLQAYLFKRSL